MVDSLVNALLGRPQDHKILSKASMITFKDNIKEPLARLYFCKYCLELRAEQSDQIQTEVDSHFCMHALGTFFFLYLILLTCLNFKIMFHQQKQFSRKISPGHFGNVQGKVN